MKGVSEMNDEQNRQNAQNEQALNNDELDAVAGGAGDFWAKRCPACGHECMAPVIWAPGASRPAPAEFHCEHCGKDF